MEATEFIQFINKNRSKLEEIRIFAESKDPGVSHFMRIKNCPLLGAEISFHDVNDVVGKLPSDEDSPEEETRPKSMMKLELYRHFNFITESTYPKSPGPEFEEKARLGYEFYKDAKASKSKGKKKMKITLMGYSAWKIFFAALCKKIDDELKWEGALKCCRKKDPAAEVLRDPYSNVIAVHFCDMLVMLMYKTFAKMGDGVEKPAVILPT